ncbi:universal stress protein [Saccharopolyspora sp. MS10]|uniref:universal stress protein n=1 Tax=Saccharopolyspora sp. MS10 TaxID=3385973 RepID=UPI0039A038A4
MAGQRRSGIVVGVDGSAPALGAVEWAAREAELRGHPVLLLAVVPGDADPDADEGVRRRARDVLGAAERVAHDFAPNAEVRGELRRGGAAEELVAESAAAHLLVVGASGLDESGARLAFGSTAEAAIALASCPVAVVRGRGSGRGGGIVVGVDAAGVADPALDWALHEAGLRGVPLLAVHTWREVAAEDWNDLSPDTPAADRERDAHRLLAERLAGAAERFHEVELRRSVEHDRPVRALLAHAARAELLVIGSRGQSGLTGMLLGSTSRALAHCAPCPLLVVRPA